MDHSRSIEPLESRQMLSAASADSQIIVAWVRQLANMRAKPAASVVATPIGFDPSAQEQEMLELINRLRMRPAKELDLLLNAKNADIDQAVADYSVDMTTLRTQWNSLNAVQPLAWNEPLAKAAKAHTQLMIQADQQAHDLPGEATLRDRVDAQGYTPQSYISENVFAFAQSVLHAHGAFAIDWGDTPSGIQDPPGHRQALTDTDPDVPVSHREIGISILRAPKGVRQTGPLVMSQELGAPLQPGNAWLLGTVWTDRNRSGFYNAGEGRGGVKVRISGPTGSYVKSTLTAGAFQMRVPAGTYTLTVFGGGLSSAITRKNVVVGRNNIKQDFVVAPDVVAPKATLRASAITTGGGKTQTLTVTYTDDALVDGGTISNSDIEIIGPNGFRQRATLASRTPVGNAGQIQATYRIAAPGGTWNATDNGQYAVRTISGQVKDTFGNAIVPKQIGAFAVMV